MGFVKNKNSRAIAGPSNVHRTCPKEFLKIQRSTHCIFSPSALILSARRLIDPLNSPKSMRSMFKDFEDFSRNSSKLKTDGFVVGFSKMHYNSSVALAGRAVHTLLSFISKRDPSGEDCMAEKIDTPSWWFRFDRQQFFVLTFSGCYPKTHSRYSFGSKRLYVLFQTEHSFDRRIPQGAAGIPDHTRRAIRKAYEKHGRPYDLRITKSPFEAYRYVKPMRLGDAVVRWWKMDLLGR